MMNEDTCPHIAELAYVLIKITNRFQDIEQTRRVELLYPDYIVNWAKDIVNSTRHMSPLSYYYQPVQYHRGSDGSYYLQYPMNDIESAS